MFTSKNAEELHETPSGVYTTKYPLTVYDKVHCSIQKPSLSSWLLGEHDNTMCLVTLKIPAESTIVLPYPNIGSSIKEYRTDQAWTEDIMPLDKRYKGRVINKAWSTCGQVGVWDVDKKRNPYMYEEGKKQVPEDPLNRDIYKSTASGVRFFATEEKAREYGHLFFGL